MPNLPYDYRSLNAINWPAPGVAVAAGATTCGGAPTNVLPAQGTPIVVGWPLLVAGAAACGVYPGPFAVDLAERTWRVAALRAAATQNGFGTLVPTAIHAGADPTEKAVLGYHMGSTLTWLMGQLSGVVAFEHLSRALAGTPPGTFVFAGPQRPDYVSMDFPGPSFQVWEAKGRTGGAVPGVLRGAFTQTRSITSIFGAAPNGQVACLARSTAQWTAHVTDPVTEDQADIPPEDLDALFLAFYRPWQEALVQQADQTRDIEVGGQTFTTVALDGTDSSYGLDTRILKALAGAGSGQQPAGQLSATLEAILTPGYGCKPTSAPYISTDGIYSATGSTWPS